VETTRYFREQVLRKRPYLKLAWCEEIVRNPMEKTIQIDGRIRYYGYIEEIEKYIRVITLEDGTTLHNAFPDRDYAPETE
jgi:hypothetical protein